MADLDYSVLVGAFKQIADGVYGANKPFSFVLGKVISQAADGTKVQGLCVQVDQKLILGDKQLILTNAVRDYYVKLTTVGETLGEQDGKEHVTEYEERKTTNPVYGVSGASDDNEAFEKHRHEYKGDKWWKVNLALQVGESVLMLRTDGGQKYIVLDRVYAPNNKGLIQ